jgi:hypothetical protein
MSSKTFQDGSAASAGAVPGRLDDEEDGVSRGDPDELGLGRIEVHRDVSSGAWGQLEVAAQHRFGRPPR